MVQKLTLTDDLDGSLVEGDGRTVNFSIEGANYEIDLSAEHTAELHGVFDKYISAGRRVRREAISGSFSPARSKSDPERLKAIREWAAANGHEVAPRGRIPLLVQDAYNAEHRSG
jgi:hypothetical protein